MKEENKGTPKNKWSQIFRKKWFFPAVYLVVAALLLSVVIWYQNLDNQVPEAGNNQNTTDNSQNPFDEDAEAVLDQQEVIKMPVSDGVEAEIVTKFFDYNADEKDRVNALVFHNNRYYQSTGIDLASPNGDSFDVVASLSGTVTEVKEDPLLGNIVVLDHGNDIKSYYVSLGEIKVEADEKVKQGDVVGTAGKSMFGKDNGVHVHFELRKDGKSVNPESFFNQPVSKLDSLEAEDVSEEQADKEKADQAETNDTGEENEARDDNSNSANTEKEENADEGEANDDSTEEKDAANNNPGNKR